MRGGGVKGATRYGGNKSRGQSHIWRGDRGSAQLGQWLRQGEPASASGTGEYIT